MERQPVKQGKAIDFSDSNSSDPCDLDSLLHPAQAFEHPANVVSDPDLTLNEKRAILASWASDACAIEAVPSLRRAPGGKVVSFDDVMEALRALDRQSQQQDGGARYRRALRRERLSRRSRHGDDDPGQGHPFN
jgi:hypothetical protein